LETGSDGASPSRNYQRVSVSELSCSVIPPIRIHAAESLPVRPHRPPIRTDRPCRWLMPAAVMLLGLGWSGEASATSVYSVGGHHARAHGHDCKCASKCRGASCCCGPRVPGSAPASQSTPQGPSGWTGFDSGPCMNSAPCKDAGLPSRSSASPVSEGATLAIPEPAMASISGRLLPLFSAPRLPARRASRIEEPPEHDGLA
jgi:hypothetical protein